MAQKANQGKHSNDNYRSISPVQELKFMDAVMADHELPMTARVVLYLLVRWTNGDETHRFNGFSWAGREKIAEWIGRDSKATITTATNTLKAQDWIIVKRRPNASSLIRPNWEKINQVVTGSGTDQPKAKLEVQETERPEVQKTEFPEAQKTGPYSADPDSTDLDSALIPGRSAPGMRARVEGDSASGADRHDLNGKKRANYQQTSKEAEQDWIELNRILTGTSEDAEHQPGKDCARGAKVHWHNLLRSGVPSSQIVLAAQGYKDRKPVGQWESGVAGFLTRKFDPDQLPDGTYPDDAATTQPPAAGNDNELFDDIDIAI